MFSNCPMSLFIWEIRRSLMRNSPSTKSTSDQLTMTGSKRPTTTSNGSFLISINHGSTLTPFLSQNWKHATLQIALGLGKECSKASKYIATSSGYSSTSTQWSTLSSILPEQSVPLKQTLTTIFESNESYPVCQRLVSERSASSSWRYCRMW